MVRISGIDVSSFQRDIDWPVVAETQSFAVLRAVRGSSRLIDSRFHEYAAGCTAAGLPFSAYYFGWPDGNAEDQADQFAEVTSGYPMALPLVLDLETTNDGPSHARDHLTRSQRTDWAVTFVGHLQDITGRAPMLYMSGFYAQDRLLRSSVLEALPMWVAHYTTGTAIIPRGWDRWHIHQWTDQRSVPGSQGNSAGATDLNWSTDELLDELIAINAPEPIEPAPTTAESLTPYQARQIRAHLAQADRSISAARNVLEF